MFRRVLAILCITCLLLCGSAWGASRQVPEKTEDQLVQDFLELEAGLFLHYGMETMVNQQWAAGYYDVSTFNPGGIVDTDALAEAAVSAGLGYGVLTAKHVSGFCLWDSPSTEYDSANPQCPYPQDVVASYVRSFRERGLKVGLYYCWRHPSFGDEGPGGYKVLPPECDPATHSREEEIAFQKKQLAELLTNYGEIDYLWNDACDPQVIDAQELKDFVRSLQPNCLVSCNFWDWDKKGTRYGDLGIYECTMPPAGNTIPVETCDKMEDNWFWTPGNGTRTPESVVSAMEYCRQNTSNYLISCGPDKSGSIIPSSLEALREVGRLRRNAVPAGSICLDDCDPSLTYSGDWTPEALPEGRAGTGHRAARKGASVQIPFTGTGAALCLPTGPQMGAGEVFLDGLPAGTLDCAAARPQAPAPVFSVENLPLCPHTLTLKTLSSDPVILDAVLVAGAGGARLDDTDPAIRYEGSWVADTWPGYYSGTRHYTYTEGSALAYTFTGTGIRAIMDRHYNRGTADIYLDGQLKEQALSMFNPTEALQVPVYEVTDLAYGPHTLRIVYTSPSELELIVLDALEVLGGKRSVNLGRNKATEASLAAEGSSAALASDGSRDTAYVSAPGQDPRLQADLGYVCPSITHVQVEWGRAHEPSEARYSVFLSREPLPTDPDEARLACSRGLGVVYDFTGDTLPVNLPVAASGRYVRLQKEGPGAVLDAAELKVYTDAAGPDFHPLRWEAPVAATCVQAGAIGHWHCTDCGRDFADPLGREPLETTETPIDPEKHTGRTEVRNAVLPTPEREGYTGDTYCADCGALLARGQALPRPEPQFEDVHKGDWFCEPVQWAVRNRITQGVTPTTFAPGHSCTRGQVVTFLWRAAGEPASAGEGAPFRDVKAGMWYEKAVLWAVEQGITRGMGPDRFGPEEPCTRAQILTFLWRAQGQPAATETETGFTDLIPTEYYMQPVLWAVETGITSGVTAHTFAPAHTCTRGQVVTFLFRAHHPAPSAG